MARIVVFDVGGVLLDWDPRYLFDRLIPAEAAREDFLTRVTPPEWNLEQDRGRPWAEAVAERAAFFPQHAALIRAWDRRWQEMVPGAIAGTVEILDRLKAAGVPLYAITNFSREKWAECRIRFPFLAESFIDAVVSAHEGLVKPDPAIYRVLLERNRLDPADCLFIDDRAENVAAAEGVGMAALRFTTPAALSRALAERGLPG